MGARKNPWNQKPQAKVSASGIAGGPAEAPPTVVSCGDSPSWVAFPRGLGCGLLASASPSSSSAAGEPAWATTVPVRANRAAGMKAQPRRVPLRPFEERDVIGGRARLSIRRSVLRTSYVYHTTPNLCCRQGPAQPSAQFWTGTRPQTFVCRTGKRFLLEVDVVHLEIDGHRCGGCQFSQNKLTADRQKLKGRQTSSDSTCKAK